MHKLLNTFSHIRFRSTMALLLVLAFLGLVIYNNYTYGRHVDLLVCGRNYVVYNPLKQECIHGQVINITTTPTTSKANPENITRVYLDTQPEKRRTCSGEADILTCNGKLYCKRNQGYQCCGFDIYHPRSQTCCQTSSSEYAVHNDKPEHLHICCKLDVFVRSSSSARCHHTANNDKFFQRQRLTIDNKICQEAKYVFRIEILQQINGQYMRARVGYWSWTFQEISGKINIRKSPIREEQIDIQLDLYSPMRKNLIGKSFLLFSSHQYLNDAVIYLRQGDFVYKCPRSRRKMIRKLKKIYRKCKHFHK